MESTKIIHVRLPKITCFLITSYLLHDSCSTIAYLQRSASSSSSNHKATINVSNGYHWAYFQLKAPSRTQLLSSEFKSEGIADHSIPLLDDNPTVMIWPEQIREARFGFFSSLVHFTDNSVCYLAAHQWNETHELAHAVGAAISSTINAAFHHTRSSGASPRGASEASLRRFDTVSGLVSTTKT
ncbi:hypothetical protein VTN31DRAFT_1750 [Thermomyces dupontii]|uniref:uncharacterized protein n=1 Tax=Talaromyces thermophilus TaxID=28565 RepID=UPI0037443C9F